jgi:hypothetical protein
MYYYIAKKDFSGIWSYSTSVKDLEEKYERLKSEREEIKDYIIMSEDDYLKGQRDSLIKSIIEIDEDDWDENLNVLPPLCWERNNGVESFCMSEMYTASYTAQYAKIKIGEKIRYFTAMVDYLDRNTWIYNRLNEINGGEL